MTETLKLGSSANIQNAASLRDELHSALSEFQKVKIDASELVAREKR